MPGILVDIRTIIRIVVQSESYYTLSQVLQVLHGDSLALATIINKEYRHLISQYICQIYMCVDIGARFQTQTVWSYRYSRIHQN